MYVVAMHMHTRTGASLFHATCVPLRGLDAFDPLIFRSSVSDSDSEALLPLLKNLDT